MSSEKQSKFPKSHYDPAMEELLKAYKEATESGAPPGIVKSIERSIELTLLKDDFMEKRSSRNSAECARLLSEARNHDWKKAFEEGKTTHMLKPGMISGTLEGQFLKSFLSAQKAKKVLEIGMFTGFGALSMAEVLPADGHLVTLEIYAYLKEVVQPLLDTSPHGKKVKIVVGDAKQSMRELLKAGEKFDAIFMDANKDGYEEYLKLCLDEGLLAPEGTVIVDNAFQHGSGYDPERGETVAKSFASCLDARSDLHKAVVPIRDGIYLVRRLSEVEGGTA